MIAPAREKSTAIECKISVRYVHVVSYPLFEKNVEWTMYYDRVQLASKHERLGRTSRFRFLRYFRERLRYAFHTQFHPGVFLPPAAKKTTV